MSSIVQSHAQDIPLSALYAERARYEECPPFQRAKIWPEFMKRWLIDSILRGFYVPAIIAQPKFDPVRGQYYWVVDGWQRLNTCFEFMDGAFKTGKSQSTDEPYYMPLEPNKSFSGLSLEAQEQFRNYPLRMVYLDNVEDSMLSVMFRRLQNQVPLTTAEKLYSYMSEATRYASEIAQHRFFEEIYAGRSSRREPFQASLYALLLEIAGGVANTDIGQMKQLAAGQRDKDITLLTLDHIRQRLDIICHLFSGTQSRILLEMVLFYQATLLLELAGFDLAKSQAGCLSAWQMRQQQEQIAQQRDKGYMSLFYVIAKVKTQKHFWFNQLATIASNEGLYTPDKPYSMSQTQRILAWIKQNGICLECKKPVRLLDINEHVFRHEDKYLQSLQTCASTVSASPAMAP